MFLMVYNYLLGMILNFGRLGTLNMIFSVTNYLELRNDIIDQPLSNWLFGHYRTLTSLLDKKKVH